MAKFALILPRKEMVEQAGHIAREFGMDVVFNQLTSTEHVQELIPEARRLGADILVARGRQASILKAESDFPVVEIRLSGQEIALLLRRAKDLVPHIQHPKIGVVTISNLVGNIMSFESVFDIELHTYFVAKDDELEHGAAQAVAEGMDVILGGDFVNAYCRSLGKRTLFFEGTEDSIREALRVAQSVGFASDAERRNTAHLQALLDYSFNGIIELDIQGSIVRVNDVASKLLDQPQEMLIGQKLADLMPAEDAELWNDALARHQELYFSALKLAGIYVVANAALVGDRDATEGIVFSFYEMNKMERQGARAMRERYRLHRYLAHGRFEDVSHASRTMRQVIRMARTFAETRQPVLLQGEVGSGKALFAQSIHNASAFAQGPFVIFRCAAGWDDQAEALSAAARNADSGTLYLSDVDFLNSKGQDVLLRLLEEDVVQTKMDELPTFANVRVIASLDGNLQPLAEAKRFRWDLYYILSAMLLELPPLRTRREDLEQAIDMCLDDCVTRLDRYVVLTKESRRVLLEYPWPGNYTQLKAFIERLVLTAPSRTIHDGYVRQLLGQIYPTPDQSDLEMSNSPKYSTQAFALLAALRRNNGNRAAAAMELGISKTTLWRRMKEYGLTKGQLL